MSAKALSQGGTGRVALRLPAGTLRTARQRLVFFAAWTVCTAAACGSIYFFVRKDFKLLVAALAVQTVAGWAAMLSPKVK